MAVGTSVLRSWWAPACRGPWATVKLFGRGEVVVRPAIVEATKALNSCLVAYNYMTRAADTGAYNCRRITNGYGYSLHAYGIAIDINWLSNPYSRRLITNMPPQMIAAIKAIRTNNGKQVWRWGGDYTGNKDSMHFEIVCSPADIRTGINKATLPGASGSISPAPATGDLMYRIHWFKGEPTAAGDQPDVTAAYRCLLAYAETSKKHWVVDAYWIKDLAELKIWKERGLKEVTVREPIRPSINYHDGPFDNTRKP